MLQGVFQSAVEANLIGFDERMSKFHELIVMNSGNEVAPAHLEMLEDIGVFWRGPGAIVRRDSTLLHRLVVPYGTQAWSLFLMGPKRREWGFAAPNGWVHNEDYESDVIEVEAEQAPMSLAAPA